MENKGFKLALVIALGIFLGVLVVSKQKQDSVLRQILNKQSQIITAQAQMDQKLFGGQDTAVSTRTLEVAVQKLTAKLNAMESRLQKLESQPRVAQAQPQPQARPPAPSPDTVHEIPVAHSHPGGAKNGEVVITEFVDYQCPFCSRFHGPMMEAAKQYKGKVTFMLKHFPLSFHQQARPAAKAALAAGEQGKFWEMSERLLNNQQSLTEDNFKSWADQIGLNVKKFTSDLKNNDAKYEQIIQQDMQLGSKVGVRGTPSFYINGRVTGARDVNSWKAEIEKELNK